MYITRCSSRLLNKPARALAHFSRPAIVMASALAPMQHIGESYDIAA